MKYWLLPNIDPSQLHVGWSSRPIAVITIEGECFCFIPEECVVFCSAKQTYESKGKKYAVDYPGHPVGIGIPSTLTLKMEDGGYRTQLEVDS